VGASPRKKIFLLFFDDFFVSIFAECRALGKAFAECPINDTRQRALCRQDFYGALFAECYTRQSLCQVFLGLCRVF